MGGQEDHTVPMLDHAHNKTCREFLSVHLKVAEHDITTPPPHESDCVSLEYFQEKFHGTSCSHRVRTELD